MIIPTKSLLAHIAELPNKDADMVLERPYGAIKHMVIPASLHDHTIKGPISNITFDLDAANKTITARAGDTLAILTDEIGVTNDTVMDVIFVSGTEAIVSFASGFMGIKAMLPNGENGAFVETPLVVNGQLKPPAKPLATKWMTIEDIMGYLMYALNIKGGVRFGTKPDVRNSAYYNAVFRLAMSYTVPRAGFEDNGCGSTLRWRLMEVYDYLGCGESTYDVKADISKATPAKGAKNPWARAKNVTMNEGIKAKQTAESAYDPSGETISQRRAREAAFTQTGEEFDTSYNAIPSDDPDDYDLCDLYDEDDFSDDDMN